MRPGHEAPEHAAGEPIDAENLAASMRPGHEAPEHCSITALLFAKTLLQ